MEPILPYAPNVVELDPMAMHVYSIKHDRQGLSQVERASSRIDGLSEAVLAQEGVQGVVIVSTCNRVEVLADVDGAPLRGVLEDHFGEDLGWDLAMGEAALTHVFTVAAGLDSMVVGEREIAGQLRRALTEAQAAGHTSLTLTVVLEEALKTSREIANKTNLDAAGRSVVSEGLELLDVDDWSAVKSLIVGTGSYAGAVVAALRRRGVQTIRVHSASGRGADFAASHDIEAVSDLQEALDDAEIVVTCRGRGGVIQPEHVSPGHKLLDLSIIRDVDRLVDAVEGVRVVGLSTIQRALRPRLAVDDERARQLIEAGVHRTCGKLHSRIVDPAVTQLRETILSIVEEEAARLPNRALTRDDAAHALRRLATRMLHVPSSRARQAAEQGRANQYLIAMQEVYGIGAGPHPDAIDYGRCPVTGSTIGHLIPDDAEEQEAS